MRVGTDEDAAPRGEPANQTIQVDALTDVQLVEHDEDMGVVSRAPPPLPPKRSAEPSRARVFALLVVAVAAGTAIALGLVHFLLPSAPAPTATFAAPTTVAAPPPSAPPPTIRHVRLDDELVIRAGAPATEE